MQYLLYLFIIALPVVLVSLDFCLSIASVASILIGFLIAIILGFWNPFTQHKHGIFSQWTAPTEFIQMKLSDKEKMILKVALSLVIGGGVALIVQLKSA